VTVLERQLHSRPVPFVVRLAQDGFASGDTLWVLNYFGEEHYLVRKGSLEAVTIPIHLTESSAGTYPWCADPNCWGQLLAPPRIASWFRFRTAAGQEGWAIPTNIDEPPPPTS
jgi:hypothetical protein